jgi:hypothetical protein|tara:strand:+ start:1233 stop:1505 length:273 start_codon:yes stop_codon:yes gene_type:complete
MTIAYKVQPYHVHVFYGNYPTGMKIDDIHASFCGEDWAIRWARDLLKDSLVYRIEIEKIKAGSRTPIRSWSRLHDEKKQWTQMFYSDPTD